MNRKQRRAQASIAKKTIRPWLMKQIERINEEHRQKVEFDQREAEQALWAILGKFDIKEAKNRWFMYGGFRSGKSNYVYGNDAIHKWVSPSR